MSLPLRVQNVGRSCRRVQGGHREELRSRLTWHDRDGLPSCRAQKTIQWLEATDGTFETPSAAMEERVCARELLYFCDGRE